MDEEVVVEAAVRVTPVLKRVILALTHIGAAAAGAAVAFKVAQDKYAKLADAEIAEAREHYNAQLREVLKPQFETPEEAVRTLIGTDAPKVDEVLRAIETYQGRPRPGDNVIETSVEIVEVPRNIFEENEPQSLDMDKELRDRDPDRPYILSIDEYMAAEPGFVQVALTFYEGDKVLANTPGDEVVDDIDGVVGAENLHRFGHGSQDRNVVYVRNVKLECDYEVNRSFGKYSEEVAGFDDDDTLQHSYAPMPRRRRHLED